MQHADKSSPGPTAHATAPAARTKPRATQLTVLVCLQVWADASAASAALARLLELSARLSAAREASEAAEGEAAAGASPMGARELELV